MNDLVPKILYARSELREWLLTEYPEFERILSDAVIPHQTVIILSSTKGAFVNNDGVMFVCKDSFGEIASGLKFFLQSYRIGGDLKASLKELLKILIGGNRVSKK